MTPKSYFTWSQCKGQEAMQNLISKEIYSSIITILNLLIRCENTGNFVQQPVIFFE